MQCLTVLCFNSYLGIYYVLNLVLVGWCCIKVGGRVRARGRYYVRMYAVLCFNSYLLCIGCQSYHAHCFLLLCRPNRGRNYLKVLKTQVYELNPMTGNLKCQPMLQDICSVCKSHTCTVYCVHM